MSRVACSYDGCTRMCNQSRDLCWMHSRWCSPRTKCNYEGCTRGCNKGKELCSVHSRGCMPRTPCEMQGCTRGCNKGNTLCSEHNPESQAKYKSYHKQWISVHPQKYNPDVARRYRATEHGREAITAAIKRYAAKKKQ